MAVHLHLGRTHLHLHDQGFPVPLDPDLLAIALRMPPHMVKQVYEMQAQRDRDKFPNTPLIVESPFTTKKY